MMVMTRLPTPSSRANGKRSEDVRAGTRATQHAFFAGEAAHHGEGIVIHHAHDAVADAAVEGGGDEGDAYAFDLVRAGFAAFEHAAFGFDRNSKDLGQALFEQACDAGEGACGADSDDGGIDAAFHLLPDFLRGGFFVEVGVGWIFKLHGSPTAGGFALEGEHAADGPGHHFFRRRLDDLRAEATHERAFFFRVAIRHEQAHTIAALHSDESQTDAGISCCGFADGAPGAEDAAAFGIEHNAEGGAVLDAAAGIHHVELGPNLGAAGRDYAIEPHHGRETYELSDVRADAHKCRD